MCVLRQPPSDFSEESRAGRKFSKLVQSLELHHRYSAKTVLKLAMCFLGFLPHSRCSSRAEGLLNYLTPLRRDSSSPYESRNECSGESSGIEKDVRGLSEFQNFV